MYYPPFDRSMGLWIIDEFFDIVSKIIGFLQTQQHDIEVKIETQKSHRKHFETRLKELQNLIKKAEREHENMQKLVRVSGLGAVWLNMSWKKSKRNRF